MSILTAGEFEFIDWVRRRTAEHPRVLIGPGDDTAAIHASTGRPLLITTDMLLEGSCFILEQAGARAVGRKALAVNLSDIAAMAGIPTAAVVSLGLPRDRGRKIAEELFEGMRGIADRFDVPLVGGDTNSWNSGLVVSVTLVGEATDKGPIRRSGAKPGDWILVTGPLGGSILGKHLDFTPRIQEALVLHQLANIHAMIDISDGLAADLHHICTESACGAILNAEAIPVSPAAHRLAIDSGRSPLDHALADGEDFELVFTVTPEDGQRLLNDNPILGITLVHIGEMTQEGYWLDRSGNREPLAPRGYVHAIG